MRHLALSSLSAILILVAVFLSLAAARPQTPGGGNYLGFDANDYPGDDALPVLRKTFSFASYWIGRRRKRKPAPGWVNGNRCGRKDLGLWFCGTAARAGI